MITVGDSNFAKCLGSPSGHHIVIFLSFETSVPLSMIATKRNTSIYQQSTHIAATLTLSYF
jgi:hypothetical protein